MTPRFHQSAKAQGLGMTSQRARDRMVERLRTDGIADERVLTAMRSTLYVSSPSVASTDAW